MVLSTVVHTWNINFHLKHCSICMCQYIYVHIGIWCTEVVVCLCNLYMFLFFLYRLDRWFSRLNDFTLVILGPFIACCSVWAKALCWRLQLVLLIVQTECGDRDSILIYLKIPHLSAINSPSLALSTAGSCSLATLHAYMSTSDNGKSCHDMTWHVKKHVKTRDIDADFLIWMW